MKTTGSNYLSLWIVLAIISVLGPLPQHAHAQENTVVLARVDFMKVAPENNQAYLNVEQNLWKPIHQKRVNSGNILGWYLYRIWFKGANDDYNYATVTLFDNLADLENPNEGIELSDIHPDKDMDQFLQETFSSRELVHTRLIQRINYTFPDGGPVAGPFQYLVINYMKPLPDGEFLRIEDEMAKPIHKELVKSGDWAGWSVWSNVFPRGTSENHQFVTVDYMSEFSRLGSVNYRDAFEKAHPDKEWNEYTETLSKSRELVLSELWEVVDFVVKE